MFPSLWKYTEGVNLKYSLQLPLKFILLWKYGFAIKGEWLECQEFHFKQHFFCFVLGAGLSCRHIDFAQKITGLIAEGG